MGRHRRGTIRRELDRLVAAGLLIESRAGNQLHYRANPANPVFHELVGIVRKTFGIADVIREVLAARSTDIVAAFIYGSIAKGTDTASSDIDVLVITDRLSYGDVVELLQPCDQELGRTVNPVVFAAQEFVDKLSHDVAFVTRVMEQPKIMLIGSADDIPQPR